MFEIFDYEFMRLAFVGGTVMAILAPTIGIFLVPRRYALIGDGLGHIAFGGIGLALFLKFEPTATALAISILAALGIERLRAAGRLSGDVAIALFLSGGLAIGLLLARLAKRSTDQLWTYLFGSILTLKAEDLLWMIPLALGVLATVFLWRRELLYSTLDEETARASGVAVSGINLLFVLLTAITIVLSMTIVGLLLISALIVLPVAAALQRARSVRQAYLLALLVSLISVYLGLIGSYYLDTPPGPTIVLSALGLFGGMSVIAGRP
ncbi:MAG: metal ABC transporter permease [Candidatus Bipolaricaulota bacterium]|nr:metal ABC transporter permease [Candidatus Bipolaricaulota bacterium]